MCHGNYIYSYVLREYDNVSLLSNTPGEASSLIEPSSRNMRLASFSSLIAANTFMWTVWNAASAGQKSGAKYERSNIMIHPVPLGSSGRSVDFSKSKASEEKEALVERGSRDGEDVKYMTTKLLEVWTRIFPLFEDDTVCYAPVLGEALEKEVLPILVSMMRTDFPTEHVAMLLVCVDNLSVYAQNNDPFLFPHTRAAVSKRRELYTQLWMELLNIGAQYGDLSQNHLLVAQRIHASAPDQTLAKTVFSTKKRTHALSAESSSRKGGNIEAEMMDIDSTTTASREQAQREAESQWMRDVSSVRHDIVGLKDISWSGAKMISIPMPLVTSNMNPSSLYSRYWDQARPRKQF